MFKMCKETQVGLTCKKCRLLLPDFNHNMNIRKFMKICQQFLCYDMWTDRFIAMTKLIYTFLQLSIVNTTQKMCKE
jgi:hypothetical protein